MADVMTILPDLAPLALACLVAFLASVLGGLSGFGTGLVLPAFLAPLVGVGAVVPVMAVAMLFNNGGRVFAFWRDIEWTHLRRMLWLGLPGCVAGAYGYTLLSSDAIALGLGVFLLASVPLRRALRAANLRFSPALQVVAGGGFGFVNGGMSGAGILLISFLMAADLAGSALIATDALISFIMGVAKVALFGSLAALSASQVSIGLVVGVCTAPGAFVARWLLRRIPAGLHAWIMEAVVMLGAVSLLRQGF
ncbi:sulfite exporter TauE/SafE family protein [Propionivibrio dicarboxylicus]|uniref:Probable membrane transporter protein n=1 Tax=Propionivibrio dicarboxylicus TaxID=83767 RepID=A0A1G8I2V7_9RHOO|nr:sulfite exporter TauE/SafE family protein [Propionivibrio dicarboxylicus]SDI13194.1 Sulfite exporter TauE/SafE [Propionivibrio dicarboxylicus]